jgi:hypothetical protein
LEVLGGCGGRLCAAAALGRRVPQGPAGGGGGVELFGEGVFVL